MGKLRYHGLHVYYHFQDQFGTQQKMSLKLKVDRVRKDPHGNEIFPTEAHALKKQIDHKVFIGTWDLDSGFQAEVLTLKEAFKKFILPYEKKSTIHTYQLSFDKLIDYFSDVPITTIDEEMMLEFRKHLFANYKKITVEFFIRHIKIFFHYAEEAGHIVKSPVTKRVRMKPVDTPIVIFSDADLEAFFKDVKAANPEAYEQLRFLLLSGWRVSDSCDLTRDKIDFERGVIQHYIGKKDKTWEYPMDTELATFLATQTRENEPFVFYYRDYHSLGKVFREIVDQKNEDGSMKFRNNADLSVHTLRKQFTYNCFRRGVPLEICSKLLGHASVKTTEKYYTYWDTQLLRSGLETSRQATGKKQESLKKLKIVKAV